MDIQYTGFLSKAQQNLKVAEWCFEQGHYDACCNRAYYAMFHAAIATLAQDGVTPIADRIDHGWVQSLFVIHFCNRRKVFPQFRQSLQDAQRRRDLADYKPDLLNRGKAKEQLTWAQTFVQAILGRLRNQHEL